MRDDATVKAFASASQLHPTNIAAAHQALNDPHGSATCREHGRASARRANLLLPGLPRRSRYQGTAMRRVRLPSPRPPPRAGLADDSPTSIATRSTPRWKSATIRSSPTSRSSSAAASAAWCRRPATSPAPSASARRCRCSRRWRSARRAVVVRPDMAKYVRVGREVRHAMQALTPLVEPLSIDEAFLDLSGTQRMHGMIPAKVLARFAREVERDIGITRVGRPVLQQVSRQDRLRSRQAARLCRDRPGRGARKCWPTSRSDSSTASGLRPSSGCCNAAFASSPTCSAPTRSS